MQIIRHRRNSLTELRETAPEFGVEIDIRSYGSELVLHHDPLVRGELFEEWLKGFQHKTLILNVKEEGLEDAALKLMEKYSIEDFYFLDQSFPFLVKTANSGERRCAVRVSEFESADTALALAGKIEWIWVDCFTRFPLDNHSAGVLRNAGFKLCLVSPELQGRDAQKHVPELRSLLEREKIYAEAVCTKEPDLWR
jgi:hypothetical protein